MSPPPATRRPPESRSADWIQTLGLIAAIIFIAAFFLRDIRTPWTQDDYYNGTVWSQAAHNLLRAGFVKTAAVPAAFYYGPLPIPPDGFYVHHPSLLPVSVAAVFAVFGESEWAARLVPLACTMASVVLLWLLIRRGAGARAATFGAIVFVTAPMELHYGQMVNFEPCTLMWMLAALLALQLWDSSGRRLWLAATLVAFVFALWTAWLAYFLVLILIAHFLFFARPSRRKLAAVLLGLALVSAGLFLLQIRAVRPDAWHDLAVAFQHRLGSDSGSGSRFTWLEWFQTVGGWLLILTSPFAWLIAVGGAFFILRKRRAFPNLRWLGWAALMLFLLNAIYLIAFRNASYIHDYAGFYFVAPVAIAAGIALEAITGSLLVRPRWRWLGHAMMPLVAVGLGLSGLTTTNDLQSQSPLVEDGLAESANFIPAVGAVLHEFFPEDMEVLCNFEPHATALPYYAQRSLIGEPWNADGWAERIEKHDAHFGAVVWLVGPDAASILPVLPPEMRRDVVVEGKRFLLWKPAPAAR